jgi:hypothetical protein
MTDEPDIEDPETLPPPVVGGVLPRAAEAFGVRVKRRRIGLHFFDRKEGIGSLSREGVADRSKKRRSDLLG